MTSDADVTLKFYDTFSREKRVFEPIDRNNVRMYVCGPTVYDYAHIGNARPAIVFDVLFRLLRHVYGEDHVTYVRNITDVDDKIIDRARRDHPDMELNAAIRAVTERTADQYQKDVTALGCLEPTVQPRATEFVTPRGDGKADMISMIAELIKRKHAYVANGEVLFSTKSMKDYGGLSKRNLDEQQAGARIAVEAHKKHPADFVLWKQSTDDEPGWDSPWGRGRPGWHIECSVMSEAYLGDVFDIHGGGLDLIFPHHENELAQSRCAHGTKKMANYWMHNGFLQVEGKKMSKSEGNFITINELLETEKFGGRKWPGEVLRLAMLMTHYREPIDFSVKRLIEANVILDAWLRTARSYSPDDSSVSKEVVSALADDLNFSQAKIAIDSLLRETKSATGPRKLKLGGELAATMLFLGLANSTEFELAREHRSEVSASLMEAKEKIEFLDSSGLDKDDVDKDIRARLAALNTKDFAKADEIRAELLEQGIQLMDYKDPDTGERKTKWEIKR